MEIPKEQLKEVVRPLLLELLAENRALFYEIVKEIIIEVFENEGMKKAIEEAEDDDYVDESEIYEFLESDCHENTLS